MKKFKYVFAFAFLIAAVSGVFSGCFFDRNVTPSSEPTYNVGYFNYTADGDSLPYGSEITNNNSNYYKSSEGLVLDDAICTGWVFDGWFEGAYWSSNVLCWDDAVKLDEISKGRTGDVNLYGKWHMGEFEISFDAGEGEFLGGEKVKSLSFEFNANVDISSLETPQRDGYDFYAWQNIPEKMPAENVTLDAEWAKKYSVSYVLNTDESLQTSEIDWTWSNDLLNPTEYSLASNISLKSATTTRPGYAFSGWYFDEEFTNGTSVLREDKIPEGSENLTLYAKWEKFFTSLDAGTLNNLNTLGRRQKEIKIPHKYVDDDGSVKTITKVGGGGSSIFSTTIGYTVPQVEKVVVDAGITSISNRSFYESSCLQEVVLPTTITRIGDYAFKECRNLSTINLSNTFDSLTIIGSEAFAGSQIGFEKIEFGETLKTIEPNAFQGVGIKEIEIYDTTTVEDGAFNFNIALEKVTIKEPITSTDSGWFHDAFSFGFNEDNRNFEVVVDSERVYKSSSRAYTTAYYGAIQRAKVIKVQKEFADTEGNVNTYLNDETLFEKTESGIYYVYTRV